MKNKAADDKELKIAKVEYESNSWRVEDAEYLPDWLVCKMFKDHCETIEMNIFNTDLLESIILQFRAISRKLLKSISKISSSSDGEQEKQKKKMLKSTLAVSCLASVEMKHNVDEQQEECLRKCGSKASKNGTNGLCFNCYQQSLKNPAGDIQQKPGNKPKSPNKLTKSHVKQSNVVLNNMQYFQMENSSKVNA
ncbi:hypothetical protein T06_3379 [Trichinella sp. T6]|nr:hypothetical protein T06_3379 [Trichinella sp. T6]